MSDYEELAARLEEAADGHITSIHVDDLREAANALRTRLGSRTNEQTNPVANEPHIYAGLVVDNIKGFLDGEYNTSSLRYALSRAEQIRDHLASPSEDHDE